MVRRVAKGLLALLLIAALASAVLYAMDPLFFKRYVTAPQALDVAAVDWRSPTAPVPGDRVPIPEGEPEGIADEAVAKAVDYAEAKDSHAFLVYRQGKLVVEHYGEGYGPESRFDSSSMHKTVLGLLLGAAIEDGSIDSLDDPVGDYLDAWSGEPRGEITLRQLATMSSGLELAPLSLSPFGKGLRLMLGSDVRATALSLRLEEPPGASFAYQNASAQILGLALMEAIDQPYAEYLSERLWQPIGAPDAAVWLDREGGTARTFCCLLTSARAWLRVGELILHKGRVQGEQVLPAAWIDRMTRPSEVNPNYGLLVWLNAPADGVRTYNPETDFKARHSEPYTAPEVIFLDGAGGQRVYIIPSAEMVIVRIGEVSTDWDDARLPNLLLRGLSSSDGRGAYSMAGSRRQ